MGVDLADIVNEQSVTLDSLKNKTLAVDAYNTLYQFLAIIRQPDGTPLKDRQGRVTSHLSGLLYRSANLYEKGIKLTFVFDGKPPELKQFEIQRRRQVREEAVMRYQEAVKEGRLEEARTYAQATSQLKDLMVEDSKRLLDTLGISWIQAPGEGEAQASYMAANGDVWAVASQDHDSLLFGAPRMVKNLAITGRRKLPRRDAYVEVEPELIELNRVLEKISLTREQLVDAGILVGTDFNDGVKGIGAKTAVKLVRENGRLEQVLENNRKIQLQSNYQTIRDIFLHPKVTSDYELNWSEPNEERVVAFLCGERDFSEERVRKAVSKIANFSSSKSNTTLDSYFG
ncbi:MAG TPA: flap endonuclease-1 [Candidatus Bathyarchaeia archaeon]|nr:flap endonuclease-1 [Candidatus Bathyarchaeia archaeon]